MAKALPRYDFLAERLRDRNHHQFFDALLANLWW